MPCATCRDAGFVPSAPRASVGEIRAALDGGAVALCGCPQGQWWLSSIYAEYGSMLDRNKVEIGNPDFRQERGVPPSMIHGAAAVEWLEKDFVRTSRATAASQADAPARTGSLGASAPLALAGLIGTVPTSLLQAATWRGPSFSPVGQSPALFMALLFGGVLVLAVVARLGVVHRTIERLSAMDDPRERQVD